MYNTYEKNMNSVKKKIQIKMMDGSYVVGNIHLPNGNQRLSDYVKTEKTGFIALSDARTKEFDGKRELLINKNNISMMTLEE
jgi:hypothetical protein